MDETGGTGELRDDGVAQRRVEARYRSLFDDGLDGILIADEQRVCVDANPSACRMLGYTREELVGKHALDIVVPDEAARIDDALRAAKNHRAEWRIRRCDGSVFPAEVVVTVMPDGNLLALVRDVSARKLAEQSLRKNEALLRIAGHAARLGGWTIAVPEGGIEWSDELCAIHEVAPGFRPTHERATEFYVPEHRAQIVDAVTACIREGTPFDLQLQVTTATGRRVWVRTVGSAERGADGQITMVQGALQDIDEQRKLQEQFRQAQKMDAIGRLAGGIAHDFNNLLSVILGYTDLLLDELRQGDPIRANLEEVRDAGRRATELTRHLLAFSRQQVFEPQVIDVGSIVLAMDRLLGRVLGEDIELSLVTTPSLGKVLADPGQVEQIIMNLVVNARDAMPRGGKLTIETANTELDATHASKVLDVAPGTYVLVAITDTGSGMPAHVSDHVFEPFFTTKEKGKGTGLGLSTVFGIVKQSRGHISVHSEVDVGTTVKVYLPQTHIQPVVRGGSAPTPAPARGAETILVVEDDPQVLTITRTILARHGYHVLDAANGGEALLICEQYAEPIHILVTDVIMPRMTGRELAERLGPMRPEMRVLYVSGYPEQAIVVDAGISYLQKPITPHALLARVREILDA